MTTYWKSQDRKYCDFCKCWFADNKVSISFHENGKRHKESVKKHLSLLSKRSAKEFKQKEKIEDDIKKMEVAAMSAYLKDVQNNADITSQSINEMLGQSGSSCKDVVVSTDTETMKLHIWHEVKNDEGNSYFWNKQTNETVWEPPENYLSLEQQKEKKESEMEEQKVQKRLKKQKEKEAKLEAKMEAKAHIAREKMRELAVDKDKPTTSVPMEFGPMPCTRPYGSWKPVVEPKVEKVDLQLPKTNKILPPVIMEPERVQFKEKRIESLGDGPVEFKKRKFNNAKRNMRQKLDDE